MCEAFFQKELFPTYSVAGCKKTGEDFSEQLKVWDMQTYL